MLCWNVRVSRQESVVPLHVTKMYGWLEVNIHAFWSSAIELRFYHHFLAFFYFSFFLSVFILYTLFLSLPLSLLLLFLCSHPLPSFLCVSSHCLHYLFPLYFFFFCFFFISFFLNLSWSFIFCVLVMKFISGNSKLAITRYFRSVSQRPLSVLINVLRHFLQPSIQYID